MTQGRNYMHNLRIQKHLMGFLILSILLCEMCFFIQSPNTSSFHVQYLHSNSVKHVNHAQISDGSKMVYEDRIAKSSDGPETFRKNEQRTLQSLIRRLSACLSTVEYLPHTFHSTLFLQFHNMTHNTSGHIPLIRCVYRKDGKKR